MLNPRVRWNVPDELTTQRPDAEGPVACRRCWGTQMSTDQTAKGVPFEMQFTSQ